MSIGMAILVALWLIWLVLDGQAKRMTRESEERAEAIRRQSAIDDARRARDLPPERTPRYHDH